MDMEDLQSDDLAVEPSSCPVEVSEGISGIPITSSEARVIDQQPQSPSRKRKRNADEDFRSDPHEPALKVLHVEEQYVDAQTNQSALIASQMESEQSFITSHRAALEELLEANEDRSGPYSVVENSAGDEFNASFRNPHGLALEGGLQSQETLRADVDNALSSSHPPLSVLATLEVIEDNSKFGEIDPQVELQALHVVENETQLRVAHHEPELQAMHVVEMTAEDEAKISSADSQVELEAPIGVETNMEDGANVRVNDSQSELEALPVQTRFEEDATLRVSDPRSDFEENYAMSVNNPYTEFGDMNVVESCAEDEANMSVSDPQPELEALSVVERAEEDGANVTVRDPRLRFQPIHVEDHRNVNERDHRLGFQPIHVEEHRSDEFKMSLSHPRSELQTLRVADNSPKADEAHVSISGPLSKLLQAHHFVGSYVVNETQMPLSAPQSYLEALREAETASVEDHSQMPVRDPPSELDVPLQVAGNSVEDQSAARKRKMVLLASVAAFFSTLAGALGSIGELVGQLEKVAMGASGISEDYVAGQFQHTGMEGMASTSSLSESPAIRLHSSMSRSSSSLRNNIVVLMFLLMQQNRKRSQKRPRELTGPWYIKPRSAQVCDSFLDFSPQGDPEKFRELFRISPTLFFHICEMVSAEMLSDTPRSLRILPNRVLTVERQVAIAIRRLATGNQFLGIADSFGVSKSTAVKVTWKFIVAFIKKATPLHLNWPNREQLKHIKDGFKSQWGFPNCCGAVDGTHFTVEFPKGEDVSQYYDHQNHVSISMQAIVGHDLRFLDVVVGWPGSIQEYQLLQNTNFFRSIVETKDRLNGDPYITQDGSSLREYVLGDGGYPLYDWLMVPYPDGISAAKDEWNSRHAVARQCVENALVRLKGTWRILSRILWKPRKERIGKMVFACCLLHNMMIERNDGLNPEVSAGVNPHPGGYTGVSVPTAEVFEGGPEAREVLFREVMGGGIV